MVLFCPILRVATSDRAEQLDKEQGALKAKRYPAEHLAVIEETQRTNPESWRTDARARYIYAHQDTQLGKEKFAFHASNEQPTTLRCALLALPYNPQGN